MTVGIVKAGCPRHTSDGVFPVTSSVLAPEALAQVVQENYPLARPISCELLKRGTNDTYLVTSGDERAVLKAYTHGMRSYKEIAGEVEFLRMLEEQKAPVLPPLPQNNGDMILTVNAPEGTRHLALWAYADGHVGDFGQRHLAVVGRSLAEIHARADRVRARPYRQELDVHHLAREPINQLQSYLASKEHKQFIGEMCEAIGYVAGKLPTGPPEYGFCHGDVGGYNSHITDAGVVTHFDFDFCGYGWRAYDLAVFLWSRRKICDADTADRHWHWLLDGYESVRPLGTAEREAVPYFVLCRQLWLTAFRIRNGRVRAAEGIQRSISFMRKWFSVRCTGDSQLQGGVIDV